MSYPQARAFSGAAGHRPFLSSPTRPPPVSASPPQSPLPSEMSPTSSSSALSPAELDRHLEARLQSLTSRPVSVYLPAPSTSQLTSRLHRLLQSDDAPSGMDSLEDRLQRLGRGEGEPSTASTSNEDLERRLRRLQGEEGGEGGGGREPSSAVGESSESTPVVRNGVTSTSSAHPFSVSSSHGGPGGEEDVAALLAELNDDIRLDLAHVNRIGLRLSQPFHSAPSSSSAASASSASPSSSTSSSSPLPLPLPVLGVPPLDVDDPLKLMEHLQSLPSTEVLRMSKEAAAAGGRRSGEGEGEEEEDEDEGEGEDEDAAEADGIVQQALDEARMSHS